MSRHKLFLSFFLVFFFPNLNFLVSNKSIGFNYLMTMFIIPTILSSLIILFTFIPFKKWTKEKRMIFIYNYGIVLMLSFFIYNLYLSDYILQFLDKLLPSYFFGKILSLSLMTSYLLGIIFLLRYFQREVSFIIIILSFITITVTLFYSYNFYNVVRNNMEKKKSHFDFSIPHHFKKTPNIYFILLEEHSSFTELEKIIGKYIDNNKKLSFYKFPNELKKRKFYSKPDGLSYQGGGTYLQAARTLLGWHLNGYSYEERRIKSILYMEKAQMYKIFIQNGYDINCINMGFSKACKNNFYINKSRDDHHNGYTTSIKKPFQPLSFKLYFNREIFINHYFKAYHLTSVFYLLKKYYSIFKSRSKNINSKKNKKMDIVNIINYLHEQENTFKTPNLFFTYIEDMHSPYYIGQYKPKNKKMLYSTYNKNGNNNLTKKEKVEIFRSSRVERVEPYILKIVDKILEKDPNSIIVMAGDHSAAIRWDLKIPGKEKVFFSIYPGNNKDLIQYYEDNNIKNRDEIFSFLLSYLTGKEKVPSNYYKSTN